MTPEAKEIYQQTLKAMDGHCSEADLATVAAYASLEDQRRKAQAELDAGVPPYYQAETAAGSPKPPVPSAPMKLLLDTATLHLSYVRMLALNPTHRGIAHRASHSAGTVDIDGDPFLSLLKDEDAA